MSSAVHLNEVERDRLSVLRGWASGSPLGSRFWSPSRSDPPGPRTLEIHPTYRCNLHCTFCKYESARERREVDLDLELTVERWLQIIEEAADMGVKEIRICGGGEPFFHPGKIEPLMRRIKGLGMRGSITTNGTLISEDFSRELVDMSWDLLELSIDAPTPELHDSLRKGVAVFTRVTSTLRRVSLRKKELGTDSPRIKISTVMLKQNVGLMQEMVKLWAQEGADEVVLLPLNAGGLREVDHRLTPAQIDALPSLIEKARKLAESEDMRLTTALLEGRYLAVNDGVEWSKDDTKRPEDAPSGVMGAACHEPWTYLQVHFDGRVSPCCHTYVSPGADLAKHSLREVWSRSKHLRKVRADVLAWRFDGRCRACGTGHLDDASRLRRFLRASHASLPPQEVILSG